MTPLILIVDDFEDAREIYATYLTFMGMRVICAADGTQAVRDAREHRPDLILMDVRMPGVTGIDALREIRADPSFAQVPIVALTAQALEAERQEALRAGFDMVITKPCLPDELFQTVTALLRQGRAAAGPASEG